MGRTRKEVISDAYSACSYQSDGGGRLGARHPLFAGSVRRFRVGDFRDRVRGDRRPQGSALAGDEPLGIVAERLGIGVAGAVLDGRGRLGRSAFPVIKGGAGLGSLRWRG